MDVNNGLFIFFFFIEHLFSVGFCLYVDTAQRSFEEAKTRCTLATPSIHYSSHGMTLDIGHIDGLQVGETAWVGYTQDYEIFRYFGCVPSYHLQRPSNVSTTTQRNIGQCQSFCKTSQYIGVQAQEDGGAKCICINVTNPDFISWIISCGNDTVTDEFAFGGPFKLSIYEVVSPAVKSALYRSNNWHDANSNCVKLVLTPQRNAYHWDLCSQSFKVLCISNKNSRIWIPESNNYGSWKKATERCLGSNTVPMPYQNFTIHEENNPQLWTSNIRAFVISNVADRTSTTQQYGYIERQSEDQYVLRFDEKLPTGLTPTRKALCDDLPGTSSVVSFPSTGSKTSRTYSESKGIPIGTTTSNISPETSSEPSFSNSSSESDSGNSESKGDSNVAVFVAVPVAIVLLIGGVVVAILFWRRKTMKKQTTDVNQNNHKLTYSGHTSKAESKAHNSENYNDIKKEHMAQRTKESEYYHEINDIDEPVQEDYDTINDLSESEPTRNSVNNHSYFVLKRAPNGNHGEDSSSDHYNYAREPDTSGSLEQGHAYHVIEKTDNKDTKTPGYSYARVMKRVEPRLEGNTYDNNTIDNRNSACAANDGRDYDHLDHGNETKQKNKRLQDKENDDDVKHVYNKTVSSVDTYDHLNNGGDDVNVCRRGNFHEFSDQTNIYNKLKVVENDGNDMYNHVDNGNHGTRGLNGGKLVEFSDQTNIYNKLKAVGHEDDNMYNHVNNAKSYNSRKGQTGKHTLTDNPYDHAKSFV